MARIDEVQKRTRLLLNPEEAPLPSDDEIADLMERAANRLENATAKARQTDTVIKRLSLARKAIQAAKGKETDLPTKAKTVHDLKEEVKGLILDDDSTTPPAPPAGTP